MKFWPSTHLSTNGIIPGMLKFLTCLKDMWKVEILSDDCTTQQRKEVLASGWIGFNENRLKWDFFWLLMSAFPTKILERIKKKFIATLWLELLILYPLTNFLAKSKSRWLQNTLRITFRLQSYGPNSSYLQITFISVATPSNAWRFLLHCLTTERQNLVQRFN